jgi:CheY-like chemotaxis protein
MCGYDFREGQDDDRWEAVRRLKNDPQTRDIPIIGMFAHAVESEREKAIDSGCDEFDAKPIEFDTLVETIRRNAFYATPWRFPAVWPDRRLDSYTSF